MAKNLNDIIKKVKEYFNSKQNFKLPSYTPSQLQGHQAVKNVWQGITGERAGARPEVTRYAWDKPDINQPFVPQGKAQKLGSVGYKLMEDIQIGNMMGINQAFGEGGRALNQVVRINPVTGPAIVKGEEIMAKLLSRFKIKPQISAKTPLLSPTKKGVTIQAREGVSPTGKPPKTAPTLRTDADILGSVGQKTASKLQTEVPKVSKPSQVKTSTPIIPLKATPEEVASTLSTRIDNFVQKTLGYTTETPTGGTRQASVYTRILRKGQEAVSRKVEQGLGSESKLIRTAASTLQNFFKGIGMSPERAGASMELRGGIQVANERAVNVMDSLYKSLGKNKLSLEKINAVLDPSMAKTKVSFNQLTKTEQQAYKIIREGLDLVHDTSYANGHISKELWIANKNKYTPRLYDVMEMPPEVDTFIKQGKRIANDLYKKRTEVTDWKTEHALNDPVYSLGKRLAQVETNTAIKKYTNFLASNSRFVSDVERAGFTKLSDSPAYGALSGKYVLNSAAEDLKGFFFSNQGMQCLYDAFRVYDRMPIRQLQKKILTVFNPTTNVGNIVSDNVFGFVTGVDPLTLNKNLIELKTNPAKFKQLNDYLTSKGITSTDITRTDFVNKMGEIDELALGKKPNVIKIVGKKIQSFYGGTDDVYKVSAFKALLDRGFTLEEATRKVADGFQNYANVGKFYDIFSKTPIVGKPFIKFQGDLIRIIKNGAVNNPLGLITFLGTLWGVARLASKVSGENEQDRITRENRFAAPMIPGLNIPLTWQTPWGELNVARYISPFYANNETTGPLSNMIPFVPNIQPKKDVASNIAININDPLVSPIAQTLLNRDFRGKPISDPNENKWKPSTLTPGEKLGNQAKFVGRAYTPPMVNSMIDVGAAAQGKPNMYGTPQTPGQALARVAGIKISQYGPKELAQMRQKDEEYQGKQNDFIDDQISQVTKGLLTGTVTTEQAGARIANLSKQKSTQSLGIVTTGNGYVIVDNEVKYLDDNGSQKTIELDWQPTEVKESGIADIDKARYSAYKSSITSRIKELGILLDKEIITQEQAMDEVAKLKGIYDKANAKTKKAKKPKKITVAKIKVPKVTISKGKTFKIAKGATIKKPPVYKIKKVKNITLSIGKSKVKAYKPKPFKNTMVKGFTKLV